MIENEQGTVHVILLNAFKNSINLSLLFSFGEYTEKNYIGVK